MIFSHALINGELTAFEDAAIPLTHSAFFTSYGVYESIQVLDAQPFHISVHLARLIASAEILKIEMPPVSILLTWAIKLINALSRQSYALKILVLGATRANEPLIIAFFPEAIPTYLPRYYTRGTEAITFAGERLLPQCKSLNTLVNHLGQRAANKARALEAILMSNGHLYEGTRSNLFVVDAKSGRLLTPPADKTLSGITKDIVIKLMADSPTPVIETPIPVDLPIAEMFITSTSMHVMPITTFNKRPVGNGKVGAITKSVSQAFEAYHKQYYANTSPPLFG